jgi:formate hydrogenlyase transcriptional activator
VTGARGQSTDRQGRQYRTLLELSKTIATHRNLADLLNELAGRLHDLVDFRSLGVWLRDGSRHVTRVHTLETSGPAVRQPPSEVPVEGSTAGWVWRHQQPFVANSWPAPSII